MKDRRNVEVSETDLTGARLERIRLNGARIHTAELAGAVVRDVDLTGAAIDCSDMDGLTINGVEVAPLIEAELVKRHPARALCRSSDPAELRAAWQHIEAAWARTYARIDAAPALADATVDGEWSPTQSLRHLLFATDVWLGEALGNDPRYHPWGLPFTGYEDFVPAGAAAFGLDIEAAPTYREVVEARQGRVAGVRALLATATSAGLAADLAAPPWGRGDSVTVLHALGVVLIEEIEHHRFVERDLDLLAGEHDKQTT